MDGVAILRELLVANAAVTALVPEDRIAAGPLSAGVELDAIAITSVSAVDRNIIAPGISRRVTERVQATALAATYPRQKALLRAIKAAAADHIGTVAGMVDVTVHTAAAGPDFMDAQASIFTGSQDFIIGFTEAR